MSSESAPAEAPFRARVFLCGADMNPIAIRKRWPQARFVGIGWIDGSVTAGIGLPEYVLGPQVWGILIETGAPQPGVYMPVTRPDGTGTTAVVSADPAAIGSLPEVLAEAHYWELPRAYRERIEAAIEG